MGTIGDRGRWLGPGDRCLVGVRLAPMTTSDPARPVTVLASASPARLAVLRSAGIDPLVQVSGVDEQAIETANAGRAPSEVVAALALAKAEAVVGPVQHVLPEAVVLGCDSMLLFAGQLRGKPRDADDARIQWSEMAGREGDLLTGHAVLRISGGRRIGTAGGTERTVIRFGSPQPDEVEAYLATGEPLQVAGSLTIDGYGGWFVDSVDGDPSSVIGLSLPLTRRLLAEVGLRVIDLWRPTEGGPAGPIGAVSGA